MVRRVDERVTTFDVLGTAFDCSNNGEFIVVAGLCKLTIVQPETPSLSWLNLRTNRVIVRQVEFHPIRPNIFACVCDKNIDVFELTKNSSIVQRISSFSSYSSKVTNFHWCPTNENLMLCCAENDPVSFWDLRDTSKPCLELELVFGANQAKFSPFHSNLMLSAHDCDMRLWDLRQTIQPINQFTGHEYPIQCLQWHSKDSNSFASSASDSLLKIWSLNDAKNIPNILNIISVNTWRMAYSPDSDELAAILTPESNGLNCVNVYSNTSKDNNFQAFKNKDDNIIVDMCWCKDTGKSTKYLYILSDNNCLCKHQVSYELINEARDKMSTPIAQTAFDEERDRLVASESKEKSLPTNFDSSFSLIMNLDNETSIRNSGTTKTDSQQSASSQSPVISEWSKWITAPNKTGGDLITELEAIRKPLIEEMYTTEVNFQRAAIGFSYIHLNKYPKINFEMRFHKNFMDNGLVFVEVLQKDSPLTSANAMQFLTLLQQESDKLQLNNEQNYYNSTILSQVFLKIPEIIESMKIFTPLNETNDEKINNNLFSDSINDENTTSNASIKPIIIASITYTPSPYDHFVPAPRNCGGRFNNFGFLVTFGRLNNCYVSSKYFCKTPLFGGNSVTINNNIGAQTNQKNNNFLGKDLIIKQQCKNQSSLSEISHEICTFNKSSRSSNILKCQQKQKIIKKNSDCHLTTINSSKKQNYNYKKHNFTTLDYSTKCNPRSLADYCVVITQKTSYPSNFELIDESNFKTNQASSISSTNKDTLESSLIKLSEFLNDKKIDLNKNSVTNNDSTSSESNSNHFVDSTNALKTPNTQIQSNTLNSFSKTSFLTNESSKDSQISLGVNRTFKPSTKFFSTLPKVRGFRTSSVNTRSFSLQNVSLLNRQKNNSMIILPSIESNVNFGMPVSSLSNNENIYNNTSGILIEEHAVMPELNFSTTVSVYDALGLLPVTKELACKYKLLGGTALELCRHNLEQVKKSTRTDLIKVWKLLEQCILSDLYLNTIYNKQLINNKNLQWQSIKTPWALHPFGRDLINSLLDHYYNIFDIQTVSMISCILGSRTKKLNDLNKSFICENLYYKNFNLKMNNNLQQTNSHPRSLSASLTPSLPQINVQNVSQLGSNQSVQNTPGKERNSRNNTFENEINEETGNTDSQTSIVNSKNSSSSNENLSNTQIEIEENEEQINENFNCEKLNNSLNELLLDPKLTYRFEDVRLQYADMLYRWGMYIKCAEIMKYCSTPIINSTAISPPTIPYLNQVAEEEIIGLITGISWCKNCNEFLKHTYKCLKCKKPPLNCALCEKPCYGAVVTCSVCSHGGHMNHVISWFEEQTKCPLNCGCECIF